MNPSPPAHVPAVDPSQWKPHERPLLPKFLGLGRVRDCVVTGPGPMRGWFSHALWRTDVYAPFNGRVMENYYSLAFFYGYDAPWNVYRQDPAVLDALRLTLDYTRRLMRDDGAIPEYAPAATDVPMLAPSSFGAMYMSFALEVAGDVLPEDVRSLLTDACRRAATFALADERCYRHATSFSNQILGAMAGAAKLTRLTDDPSLLRLLDRSGEALLGDFMSPPEMGFLYEQDGPDTFAYFFTTLWCLVALHQEWPDDRVAEVLRRHGRWMSRWMLPEPDGRTVLVSTAHETRSAGGFTLQRRAFNGITALLDHRLDGRTGREDERRFLGLLLTDDAARRRDDARWQATTSDPAALAELAAKVSTEPYQPVNPLLLYPPHVADASDEAVADLPCRDATPRVENLTDARGNQYVFARQKAYYAAFAFPTRASRAFAGPQSLWLDGAGTIILSANAGRGGWETRVGEAATGTALAAADVESIGGQGDDRAFQIKVRYEQNVPFVKSYTLRPGSIDVGLLCYNDGGRRFSEHIPLLLRTGDVIRVDNGVGPPPGVRFSAVTRTLTVERGGRSVLRLELATPALVRLTPGGASDTHVPTTLGFQFGGIVYNRLGYRLILDEGQA